MAKLMPFAAPLAALALPLLTACAVGPNFKRPAAPQVSDYTSQPVTATAPPRACWPERRSTSARTEITADWWVLFHSTPLNELIEQRWRITPI